VTQEPVAIASAVRVALMLAVSFGLKLTVEQVALIVTLVELVLAPIVRHYVWTTDRVAEVATEAFGLGAQVVVDQLNETNAEG
jgi:hypothetical protein